MGIKHKSEINQTALISKDAINAVNLSMMVDTYDERNTFEKGYIKENDGSYEKERDKNIENEKR